MPKNYVNNAYNRSVGRVGQPVGSHVISRSSGGGGGGSLSSGISAAGSSTHSGASGSTKTYVDNAYNRREGRAGMPIGSCVISKNSTGNSSTPVGSGSGSGVKEDVAVYADNPVNRRLGRVGKPRGTCVYSQKDGRTSTRTYVDNEMNRKLGRVVEPLGSRPVSGKSSKTEKIKKLIDDYTSDKDGAPFEIGPVPDGNGVSEYSDEIVESVMSHINRKLEELRWRDESKRSEQPQSSKKIIEDYRGQKIDFDEIELGKKIGHCGFGDVFFASWRNTVVAVKKLRVQRVSNRRLQEFTQEVLRYCKLKNENIVTFIGACVVTPNLALVMEYMQMSLFDALHIEEGVDFREQDKISIMCETVNGLQYLHDTEKIAHCDMKSQNVLLNYEPDVTLQVKLTDFGLSMVKSDAETSLSAGPEDLVRNVGTPRYSAPEVLRGEYLSAEAMMMSDVYSLGLIFFEVIYEEEPFYDMTYAQLQKQVGDAGKTPKLSADFNVDETIKLAMTKCWLFDPSKRPDIKELAETLKNTSSLY